MGCNVNIKLFQGFQLYVAAGTEGRADFDAAHRRLEPGLPGSVRLHRRPAERQQHPRRRTTTTSRTSTTPAINKQIGRGQQADRRGPLQGVRQPRRPDHARATRRGRRTTTATCASSSRRKTGGYLFQPANASADLNTLLHQVGSRRSTKNDTSGAPARGRRPASASKSRPVNVPDPARDQARDVVRYLIRRIALGDRALPRGHDRHYVLFFIIPANPAKQACGQACTTDRGQARRALPRHRPAGLRPVRQVRRSDLVMATDSARATRSSTGRA